MTQELAAAVAAGAPVSARARVLSYMILYAGKSAEYVLPGNWVMCARRVLYICAGVIGIWLIAGKVMRTERWLA